MAMVVLFYESFRQLFLCYRSEGGSTRFRWLTLCTFTSFYPIFYNHDVMFMYLNDSYLQLVNIQLLFCLTDDVCIILRWLQMFPQVRIAFRFSHVLFNLA